MNEQKPVSKPAPIRAVAGPELDAAVAEHVFGLRRVEGQEAILAAIPEMRQLAEHGDGDLSRMHLKRLWVRSERDYYCEECGNLPSYSSDIAAAWQVVEKMRDDHLPLPSDGNYHARDLWFWGPFKDQLLESDSAAAPLLICITALRSKGIEVVE